MPSNDNSEKRLCRCPLEDDHNFYSFIKEVRFHVVIKKFPRNTLFPSSSSSLRTSGTTKIKSINLSSPIHSLLGGTFNPDCVGGSGRHYDSVAKTNHWGSLCTLVYAGAAEKSILSANGKVLNVTNNNNKARWRRRICRAMDFKWKAGVAATRDLMQVFYMVIQKTAKKLFWRVSSLVVVMVAFRKPLCGCKSVGVIVAL